MKKEMIVWMIFGSNLLNSFLMLAIYSFSCTYVTGGHRQAVYISGLNRLCATHFLTLLRPSLGFDP